MVQGTPAGLQAKSIDATGLPLAAVSGTSGQKRRRLTPPEQHQGNWFEQLQVAAAGKAAKSHPAAQTIPPENNDQEPDLEPSIADAESPLAPPGKITPSPAKTTKTLKLNGAGGLGTPSERKSRKRKKQTPDDEPVKSPRPARRKKKSDGSILILRYGQLDDALRISTGQKIDAILSSPAKLAEPKKPSPTKKSAVNPLKPSHPFFSEKPPSKPRTRRSKDEDPDQTAKPRPAMSFSTPGKLNALRHAYTRVSYTEDNSKPEPRRDMIYKLPGTVDPAWPPINSSRVEPIQPYALRQHPPSTLHNQYHKIRRKARPSHIDFEESVLDLFSTSLTNLRLPTSSPSSLNLPRRALMSGSALREQVLVAISKSSAAGNLCQHPLLTRLLDTVSSTQSAFDRGQCETQAWSQKYAPRTCAEILQPEKEVRILKEWLQIQTVNSTRISDTSVGRPQDAKLKRRKKRRKVADELDDFIVEDEDEGSILRDLSDDEGSVASVGTGMRSLVQDDLHGSVNPALVRKANAVLISGPIGCGKTAAVYALARELDFEVFDIGPNTQRSGRDILNKVGNMAQYHQVSRGKDAPKPETADKEPETEDEDSTLPTERSQDQSSLASFFTKPKVQSKPKQARKVIAEKPLVKPVAKLQGKLVEDTNRSTRQTQSLILLEEVDILFEQDKQFWETVLELAAQSRRPIIMTCNDESLVPVDHLNLHAVLRFRMPPMLISTQFLTLVAAAEGHLVEPNAVATLLQSKKFDVRAAMAELSFWCQMALGDQKGGLEWYLPQWPAGADVDAAGQKLRVVSEGTYKTGMGFLENMKSDEIAPNDDSQLQEAWEQWSVNPTDVFLEATNVGTQRISSNHERSAGWEPLLALRDRETSSDMMSAVDTTCRVGLPSSSNWPFEQIFDPTQPPMSDTARADRVEGRTLLETPELIDYQCLDTQLVAYYSCRALDQLPSSSSVSTSLDHTHTERQSLRKRLLELYHNKRPSHQRAFEQCSMHLMTSLLPLADPMMGLNTRAVLSTEIGPYVRSIARFDLMLEQHRAEIAGPGHKARKTRASRSALEGGQRSQTRRERWFGPKISLTNLVDTAGKDWQDGILIAHATNGASRSTSSREGSIDELAGTQI